jgi:S-disulfanyl-L-cysteine oxidoreductase SoxD
MCTCRYRLAVALFMFATGPALSDDMGPPAYGLGRPATQEEIQGWDIDVTPGGAALPDGRGSVAQGRQVYAEKCAACHGSEGQGVRQQGLIGDRLVGGIGSLATVQPVKSIGSYWPYATTLFDYVRRAMPFNAPQSLTADQVCAVTAYLLHMNGLADEDAVVDRETLPRVKMPNVAGFVGDPRPDTANVPCLRDCK